MHTTLSFILAITVLTKLCDASCDPWSLDTLPQAEVTPSWRSEPIEIINKDNNAYLCQHFDCRVISHEELASRLPGTFFNITEYSFASRLPYVPQRPITNGSSNNTASPCSLKLESDGDYCCPATRYVTCFTTPQAIMNIYTQLCWVVALSNMFQCVTFSACCGGGTCSGNGRSCRLEDSMQSLFVWNVVSNEFKFEMFQFPASCTCKSN